MMETIPFWVLTLFYWLHMLATVTWIGGLAALTLLVLPAARRTLDIHAYPTFLTDLQRRLNPLGWTSLLVLLGTGMFQMSANPNYKGFLAIENRWAAAILTKHLIFVIMAGVSGYITWVIMPKMQRIAIRYAARRGEAGREHPAGDAIPEAGELQRQETLLLRLNLILGVLILALTALARSS